MRYCQGWVRNLTEGHLFRAFLLMEVTFPIRPPNVISVGLFTAAILDLPVWIEPGKFAIWFGSAGRFRVSPEL